MRGAKHPPRPVRGQETISIPWPGLRSPAKRLNGKRYHPEWLQNLLVSAAVGGYRNLPRDV